MKLKNFNTTTGEFDAITDNNDNVIIEQVGDEIQVSKSVLFKDAFAGTDKYITINGLGICMKANDNATTIYNDSRNQDVDVHMPTQSGTLANS